MINEVNEATPEPGPDDVDAEQLIADVTDAYLARLEQGERPSIDEYAERYPEIAAALHDLLPALCMIRSEAATRVVDSADVPAEPPKVLGDFRIVRELGRGGMGIVYEAEQISLGRRVALKVLPLAAALDPKQLQRFQLEAQAAAHLHHSHIVPIYSVGCERGVYYYAMQYIDGRSLAEVIGDLRENAETARPNAPRSADPAPGEAATHLRRANDRGAGEPGANQDRASRDPVPGDPTGGVRSAETVPLALGGETSPFDQRSPVRLRTAVLWMVQAAEALEHAHAMGVVHRDIKPANLLLDVRGTLFITDFGLARLQGGAGLTMTGDLAGTLRYMSPEQATGRNRVVDHRTDIYSLGATLYELLALHPAFGTSDRPALLRQIAEIEPPPPRAINHAIPVDLETVVLKAMAKEPERRYGSALELADDLRRFLEHRPILARRPSLWERAAKWARRHRALATSALVMLILTAVGLAVSTALIARAQWHTQTAYNALTLEQQRTRLAYQSEADQRRRAERSFRQARQIVDFFTEVSEEELAQRPELQGLRRMLLSAALDYYQDFIRQAADDPSLQAQLAASHVRVAAILDEIGSKADALAALERAHQARQRVGSPPGEAGPARSAGPFGTLVDDGRLAVLHLGRELNLLNERSVQEELGLTADQIAAIERIHDKRGQAFHQLHLAPGDDWAARRDEMTRLERAYLDLLRPEQSQRLRQIALQQRGTGAFNDPEVIAALRLTEPQRQAIQKLQEQTRNSLRDAYRADRFQPDEWHNVKELWRQTMDQIREQLNDEQRQTWQGLTGEPFNGRLKHRAGHRPHPPHFGPREPRPGEPPKTGQSPDSAGAP